MRFISLLPKQIQDRLHAGRHFWTTKSATKRPRNIKRCISLVNKIHRFITRMCQLKKFRQARIFCRSRLQNLQISKLINGTRNLACLNFFNWHTRVIKRRFYFPRDINNYILIENVLLIITFLVPKLDDSEIVLLTRGVTDALSSNGKCFALA